MALELRVETFEVKDTDLDVPNGDPDITYTLRQLTRPVIKELRAKYEKDIFNSRTHLKERILPDGAAELVNEDYLDYALVAWTGVTAGGKPAPCDRDYKLQLDAARMLKLIETAMLSRARVVAADVAQSF